MLILPQVPNTARPRPAQFHPFSLAETSGQEPAGGSGKFVLILPQVPNTARPEPGQFRPFSLAGTSGQEPAGGSQPRPSRTRGTYEQQ